MRILICILAAAFLAVSTGLAAQTGRITLDHDIIEFMNTDHNYLSSRRDFYSRVEGSPYLVEEFREGSMAILDRRFPGLSMRYNAYEGYFEIDTGDGIKYLDPRKTPADTAWMEDESYVYVIYDLGKGLGKTYMQLMNQGATAVLLHQEIALLEAEEAQGYQDARQARFDQRPPAWYIQVPGKAAMKLRGKKDLKEIFPDHYQEMAAYMKSENLKLKDASDLSALCRYADSLE